jgi:hypothetical protein
MARTEVVSVSDVLAKAGSNVHGNCSKAVLHQVPESETSLFSVNPGEKLAPHLHTRTWDLFSWSPVLEKFTTGMRMELTSFRCLRGRSAPCRRVTRTKSAI